MSTQPTFDAAWPELANRLRGSLIVRGVPAQDRDDVVQETALRVYRAWDTVDPDRPLWPFVVTVALNIWRDMLRERAGRDTDIRPTSSIELVAGQDVERAVLARQELASVGVAMRSLAPEQRRLLLATEEFADPVRPLLPAERVARMRARRQLARAVGRASAFVALIWLRRPARAAGLVATAYAGAMAAAVMTSPMPLQMPAPAAGGGAHHLVRSAAARTHPNDVVAAPEAVVVSAPRLHPVAYAARTVARPAKAVRHPHASRTTLCSPERPPGGAVAGGDISIGSAGVYEDDGGDEPRPIVTTPPVQAQGGAGCVAVG